jgi:ornithine--oxo-acid transaminase
MLTIKPGQHGSTYGGNPVAAAVATASLQVLVEEKLAENAEAMGRLFRQGLNAIKSPSVQTVRGKVELSTLD